ncbi:metal-dependent transcriptional regulator [bacterium]|nr:metal-dependent transcriptional regulator [bacterium]
MAPAQINDNSSWRAFEDAEPTHSAAHYLTTIMHLKERMGYARVTDLAEHLGVSRGAASRAAALLKERGWIEEDPNRMLLLTDSGRDLARSVERNYLIMECFLEDILGVPGDIARRDACKLEHLLSGQTGQALFRLVRVLNESPKILKKIQTRVANLTDHSPFAEMSDTPTDSATSLKIEDMEPLNPADPVCSLADLEPGRRAIVSNVKGQGAIHRRLLDMGITKGTAVQLEQIAPLGDPIKIRLRGYDLSLRMSEARMIEVEDADE